MKKIKIIVIFTISIFLNVSSLGQEISTVGEIYDFEIGDEYHRWGLYEIDEFSQWYQIDKIIDKVFSTSGDTIFYSIYRQYSESTESNPNWTYQDTTITEYYTNLDLPINNGDIDSVYSDTLWFNGRIINSSEQSWYDWYELKWFVNGCGLGHHFTLDIYANKREIWLVYYNKNGEEYGEPIIITNKYELDLNDPELIVYPNPSFEGIFIKYNFGNSKSQTIEIFNIQGRLVKQITNISENNSYIEISNLPSGTYVLRFTIDSKILESKFIKR